MGYSLVKFLPGVDANRKLFYLDSEVATPPPALDKSISPGSVALHPTSLTKYILASNYTWAKYVGEQKPTDPPLPDIEGGQGYYIIAYMPGIDTDRKLYYLDNGEKSLTKLNAEQDGSHIATGSQATDIRTGKRWIRLEDGTWIVFTRSSGGGGGGGGGNDKSYVFTQTSPSSVWTIDHGLDKYPSVFAQDDEGDQIIGDIRYTSNNQVIIDFCGAPVTGIAYLN